MNQFIKTIFVYIFLAGFCLAQTHRDWSYNLGMYEVNMRQYTEEGTFEAFSAHLDRLQEMGVGMLWFMPIHPIGEQNRLGSLGSYYSVRNYLEVNPNYGTLDDFKSLVREIHDRGMYVILDWVANHTAWDNVLTTTHPEWYATDSQGNFIPPPGTNWSDVIELDYSQQGLRDYMIDAMKFWVEEGGIDGFRFDAVSFVPDDFWREAIDELTAAKPDIFLLAEGDGGKWHNMGFHMTFGWSLYGFGGGVLKRIVDDESTALSLRSFAANERSTYGADAYRLYFTANHDENSWHGTTAELFGDAAAVCAVLIATLPGMPLVYSGQESGLDKRLAFFDKDAIDWGDYENKEFYTSLLQLKKDNQALWNGDRGGDLQYLSTSNRTDVFAFIRENAGDRLMVAANLSAQPQTITLDGEAYVGLYQNVFTEQSVTLTADAEMQLPAWGYGVFEGESDTGVLDEAMPSGFKLEPNVPNPFNAATTIAYSLDSTAEIFLGIYDIRGRKIESLVSGPQPAGRHTVSFDASELSSGLYFYRLETATSHITKRLLVLR